MHFEPVTGFEAQWGEFCAIHRKPLVTHHLKIERFLIWAQSNIKRLEPMMEKDMAKQAAMSAFIAQQTLSAGIAGMSAQQQAMQNIYDAGKVG